MAAGDRPATAKAISDGCIRGAQEVDQIPAEALARFCGCYAGELLNTATVRDLKSIETYRFQIKVDRASLACRAKLNLASK